MSDPLSSLFTLHSSLFTLHSSLSSSLFTRHCPSQPRPWQQAVAVGDPLASGRQLAAFALPGLALLVVRVIRELDADVFFAAASDRTEEIESAKAVALGRQHGLLEQRVLHQIAIQLAIRQMVRVGEDHPHGRHRLDHFPQLRVKLLVIERGVVVRDLHSAIAQDIERHVSIHFSFVETIELLQVRDEVVTHDQPSCTEAPSETARRQTFYREWTRIPLSVPQPYFPNAPLHQRLESSVARRTGARGWDYWRQRRVRLMHREEDLALFAVRGDTGSVYEVSLRIDGTELMASCECPYVEMELDLCKHIWATVLEASHQGWFQNARSLDLDVFEQEAPVPRPRKPPPDPEWKRELEALQSVERPHRSANIPPGAEIHYTLDVNSMRHDGSPTGEIGLRTRKKNGELSKPRSITVNPEQIAHLPDERDREILSLASGGSSPWPFGVSRIHMAWPLSRFLLPRLCNTGRLTLRTRDGDRTATWDGDTAWTFAASVDRDDARYAYIVSGHFERGEERLAIHEPLALLAGGLLFMSDRIAPLDDGGAFEWIALLRHRKTIEIPFKDAGMLPRVLAGVRRPAQFAMPDELRITDIHIAPVPCLTIRKERFGYGYTTSLCFDYQGTRAEGDSDPGPILREEARTVIHRDVDAELAARLTLKGLGASHHIDPRKLDSVIHALL